MAIVLFALLALLLFGVGFTIHLLWIVAVIVGLLWLLGFVVHGSSRRWYRW